MVSDSIARLIDVGTDLLVRVMQYFGENRSINGHEHMNEGGCISDMDYSSEKETLAVWAPYSVREAPCLLIPEMVSSFLGRDGWVEQP